MKIGILTFHYAYNYGAVLQAEALLNFLSQLGYDVAFVDYKNKSITDFYGIIDRRGLGRNKPFMVLKRILRYRKFKKYISNFPLINKDSIVKKGEIDVLVVGSDQVWNYNLTSGFDSYYWLDVPFTGKKVAYAASMNSSDISKLELIKIKQLLSNFDYISVREQSLKELLTPLSPVKVDLVLDPTLMIDPEYWTSRVRNSGCKGYVLAYPLRDTKNVINLAKRIAKAKGKKLIVLRGMPTNSCHYFKEELADPFDFLTYFVNADYVVTSSFHGTAFSLIFQKQFYTLKCTDNNNVRTESLLMSVGLSSRFVTMDDPIKSLESIDYKIIRELLSELRQISQGVLINYLSKV